MRPQRVLRFRVPDRETLDALASGAPPEGLRSGETELDAFREIHYDTPQRDLATRGVSVRVRVASDGTAELMLDVLEHQPASGSVIRQRARAKAEGEPDALLRGDTEAARLLRALTDVDRLGPALELETLRRRRRLTTEAGGDGLDLSCDLVTVRRGGLSADLLELEVALPDDGAVPFESALMELRERHRLAPSLGDTATRARDLLDRLDVTALEQELRASVEVAVLAYAGGAIALRRKEDGLRVPSAPGSGAHACRRALRRAFGRSRGRIRLLGRSPGGAHRPVLEVWLAEMMGRDAETDDAGVAWLPVEEVLGRAGGPELRHGRTLAALQVLARSGLATALGSRAGAGEGDGSAPEPVQVALQRLRGSRRRELPSPKDVAPDEILNPELSRLAFDERILVMAESPELPLLERVRFLSMFGTRRDDFTMSRVARFKERVARSKRGRTLDGLTAAEQLDVIAIRSRHMMRRADRLLRDRLLPELQRHGIHVCRWSELAEDERAYVLETYTDRLDALLTPIVSDPAHPFPHVRNLRPALAAMVRLPGDPREHLVAVELPGDMPRFVPVQPGRRFVPLEDVVEASLPLLYRGLELVRTHTFRVTRSAEIDWDDDPVTDVLQDVEEEVQRRPFQQVVRLEVERSMPPDLRAQLLHEFRFEAEDQISTLDEKDVYAVDRLVDLAALAEIAALERPGLRFPPLERQVPFPADRSVFDLLKERERLVHFPYDAFEETVERLLREAAEDPDVVAVKVTLYRTSRQSAVVDALREAREAGKDAVAMVELKASFDERRNIRWARGLEEAGIRVVFSPPDFKVHAKIALIVRREGGSLRRYAYIGTGNLNATTAATYIDVGLFTADPELTQEVNGVFNLLTGYSGAGLGRLLLVAPFNMRERLLDLIEREIENSRAGRPAGIRAQLNGLNDRRLIGALYRASEAGVPIDLMVREICALRPGVPGLSENIRVVSLLGRFLQHARIFEFTNGGATEYFLGSADWRPRNLTSRVEVVTPARDPVHQAALRAILDETLNDPEAWEIRGDGTYVRGDEVVGA